MATTLGNGLGPRTQICSMAKGSGDHDQQIQMQLKRH